MAKGKKMPVRQLCRPENNRIIGGVCGGIGEYFAIDPIFIRLVFLFLFFYSGSGILIYLILWLILPSEHAVRQIPSQTVRQNWKEMKSNAHDFVADLKTGSRNTISRRIIGLIIIVLGIVFLLDNFNITAFDYVWRFWPLLLVALGLGILIKHEK